MMFGNKLPQLVGILVGTALSYGAISSQLDRQAQAAVLTSNFEANISGDIQGAYGGTFTFDNSSLTGQGSEWLPVLSGVFNFVQPDRTEKAYDLTNGRVTYSNGNFVGLSVSGESISEQVMRNYIVFNQQGQPVTIGLHGKITWSMSFYPDLGYTLLGGFNGFQETPRFDKFFSGKVVFSEPVEVASVPVPEPTTVIGTALAIVGLAKLKRRKKACI